MDSTPLLQSAAAGQINSSATAEQLYLHPINLDDQPVVPPTSSISLFFFSTFHDLNPFLSPVKPVPTRRAYYRHLLFFTLALLTFLANASIFLYQFYHAPPITTVSSEQIPPSPNNAPLFYLILGGASNQFPNSTINQFQIDTSELMTNNPIYYTLFNNIPVMQIGISATVDGDGNSNAGILVLKNKTNNNIPSSYLLGICGFSASSHINPHTDLLNRPLSSNRYFRVFGDKRIHYRRAEINPTVFYSLIIHVAKDVRLNGNIEYSIQIDPVVENYAGNSVFNGIDDMDYPEGLYIFINPDVNIRIESKQSLLVVVGSLLGTWTLIVVFYQIIMFLLDHLKMRRLIQLQKLLSISKSNKSSINYNNNNRNSHNNNSGNNNIMNNESEEKHIDIDQYNNIQNNNSNMNTNTNNNNNNSSIVLDQRNTSSLL